jgi:hypothetical protein
MKLDENFTLEGEAYNWTLKYEKDTGEKTEKGKPIISKDRWYYPKIEMALKKYFDECLKPAQDVKQLSLKIDEVLETIERLRIKDNK